MYNKLFGKILDSSIWLETSDTRVVWMTLLAAMDQDGFVPFASLANLALRARVALDVCALAVKTMEAPDPNSSDPDNEGRRIERVPGGWLVLNAAKYRDMVTRDIARERTRLRVAKHRAAKAAVTLGNVTVTGEGEKNAKDARKQAARPSEASAAVTLGAANVTPQRANVTPGNTPVTHGNAKTAFGNGRVTQSEAYAEAFKPAEPRPASPSASERILFEKLAELEGSDPAQMTRQAKDKLWHALATILAVCPGLTPWELDARAKRYRDVMPKDAKMLTGHALAMHWAKCAPKVAPVAKIIDGPPGWRDRLEKECPGNLINAQNRPYSELPEVTRRKIG
jgi:hypothetical protein